MIKSISFKNYRSFKTKQTINIKPITILVGPNSSGKSSILKILGLLKQSVQNNKNDYLNYSGDEVDFEGFDDVVYRNKSENLNISFSGELYATVSDLLPGVTDDESKMQLESMSPREVIKTNQNLECSLHLKKLEREKPNKGIIRKHPLDRYEKEGRERFRPFHSIIKSNTKMKVLNSPELVFISSEFDLRGDDGSGNLFTSKRDRGNKNDNSIIKSTREKIKNILDSYVQELKKVNRKYKNETEINNLIDEIIWFLHFEEWMVGSSFFPEYYNFSGNLEYENFEYSLRPTPKHDYLNWKKLPFVKYWEYRKKYKPKIQISKKFSNKSSSKDDSDKIVRNVKKRIDDHWKTLESAKVLKSKKFNKYIEQTIWWYIDDLINALPISHSKDENESKSRYCRVISSSIKANFDNIININALRPAPKKYYTLDELKSIIGDEEVNRLISHSDAFDGIRYDHPERYLSILGFDHYITIKQFPESPDLFSISLTSPKDNLSMTVDKFGFGFSQILPLVFARCRTDKLIIVEQPELHLHPKAQSRLADFFSYRISNEWIDVKNIRKKIIARRDVPKKIIAHSNDPTNVFIFDSKTVIEPEATFNKKNKFFIETHSEHLIRRLQVLIARGELSNDDVAIYYVDKNRLGNSFVKEYKINERGFFNESWPEGFFDNISNSLMELWKSR